MKYREYPAHPELHDHVGCCWMLEREYGALEPYEDVTPDAHVELIFNFGAPYLLVGEDGRERAMPVAILVGLLRKPLRFRAEGTVKLIAARLHAWAALPFVAARGRDGVGEPARAPAWRVLQETLGARVDAGDYDGAIDVLQDHLRTSLVRDMQDRRVRAAALELRERRGQVGVERLAESGHLSVRQLQRRFRDATGTTPKQLARTVRFEEVRRRLMFDPDANLTALAHEFGYTDQAHFNRDFRDFCARTPGEFAEAMRALQATFRDREHVVFLQGQPDEHG